MTTVMCTSPGVYALTRGKAYEVLDQRPGAYRLRLDNGRHRWCPDTHFDPTTLPPPMLVSWRFEHEEVPPDDAEDVEIEFDDGTWRWCTMITPGQPSLLLGTQGHFWSHHLVVVPNLTRPCVDLALRPMDAEGTLVEATVPMKPRDLATMMSSLVGRKLEAVHGDVMATHALIDEGTIGSVWLKFEGREPVVIGGHGNGSSLVLQDGTPMVVELDDGHEVIFRDVSHRTPLKLAVGRRLLRVYAFGEPDDIQGLRLDFGDGIEPIILNWDDELYIQTERPPLVEWELKPKTH